MIVAGVMSGTSADGINVAFARLNGRGLSTRLEFLGHSESSYPTRVRQTILQNMNAARASVADLSRLSFLLAELYAEAIARAKRSVGLDRIELIGCHGQTLYHQGETQSFLGRPIACTWQAGDGAILAARAGCPVVSDFRPADMAAGGKGAPLVPYLDYLLFRDRKSGRILQNIGGIGNLTAIPADARPDDVIAFDTGPGNMVMDAVVERLYDKPFDRGGRIAASGRVMDEIVSDCLRGSYFRAKPPKTAGREEFGREYAMKFLKRCGRARKEDVVATAAALTTRSIGMALRSVTRRGMYHDYIVTGGGAKNETILRMLRAEIQPLGLSMRELIDLGVPPEAKEALAFAVLAYQTWNKQPSNIPTATGAGGPAILGKISYVQG